MTRVRVQIHGAVQGVGFRPFVYRLAHELNLAGSACNSPQGVTVEIEGGENQIETFHRRLSLEKPAAAVIQRIDCQTLPPLGELQFSIRETAAAGRKTARILPDLAVCSDCLRELFNPGDRRHLYPFSNCVQCGPRFSILEALPYDRHNTTMRDFVMCEECASEYHDPASRRFHAQPNACPQCGPRLQLVATDGKVINAAAEALRDAAQTVRDGRILALKGIGGFQLMVDARSQSAVARLRERKHRAEKPFAVLFPSLESARQYCRVSAAEAALLASPAAPVVLCEGHASSPLACAIAPHNPNLGVMLPYSPLHHLLTRELGFPIVATSGNLSDEPICLDLAEAAVRLAGIADVFLDHNRRIARHMDDSVARVIAGRETVLRAARGYAPLALSLPTAAAEPILAVGAHLKNTVALASGSQIFISQHIGDLETPEALRAFHRSTADLPRLYDSAPRAIACDPHPEYQSTKFARDSRLPVFAAQHHFAHVLSCLADNEISGSALGVCWDGAGLGPDGTIWGGEFLRVENGDFRRVARFRHFRLPGGDAAIRQPRRSALGVLHELFDAVAFRHLNHFSPEETRLLSRLLATGVHAPLTSSAGRLFDAIASILGLRQHVNFEGQAAMELEFAAAPDIAGTYPFVLTGRDPTIIDWEPMLRAILRERATEPVASIAAKFHNTLVEIILALARSHGEPTIALTGGCFQNKRLAESAIHRLRAEGFAPCWHRRLPCNDGGVAPGQIIAALARQNRKEPYVPGHPRQSA